MTHSTGIPNRLINETSPYLLQHVYNPVDWFPWGNEAFDKANAEDKPVFLSIGYSTCHWCHVMARESFEDPEVAAVLNRDYISVKVDKEERPDIDSVYMGVCQALTGSGGWPLTILLTPERSPFFAGTYFPKRRRSGHPGLLELLPAVSEAWRNNRNSLLETGDKITTALSQEEAGSRLPADRQPVLRAAEQLEQSFDARYGGFGMPPKFPMPHNLLFLLHCHHLGVGKRSLERAEATLKALYRGGIFDHIGGGFSRYSTDEKWLAPHFEKMLYDNALLVIAYLEGYLATGDSLYKGVAEKTLRYIEREMTAPEGGFYSAQDADIEGEEGKFYTFTVEEIARVLDRADHRAFCEEYGVRPGGNFEGKSIPNRIGREASLPDPRMEAVLEQLYAYRAGRYRLHRDDKRLTSWNALMIAAYAKAARVLGNTGYLHHAERAYVFLERHLAPEDGKLFISWRDGRAKGEGLLDDYAFLAWACLELYESTFQARYLERACALLEKILADFASPSGGFYLSSSTSEALILRPKEYFDGAMPSGNSVAAWCLARFAALTGETCWREAADRQLSFCCGLLRRQPTVAVFALLALMQAVYPSQELICTLPDEAEKAGLALTLGSFPHPQAAILVKSASDEKALSRIAPFTKEYPIPPGTAQYYLCRGNQCEPPQTSLEIIKQKLCSE